MEALFPVPTAGHPPPRPLTHFPSSMTYRQILLVTLTALTVTAASILWLDAPVAHLVT